MKNVLVDFCNLRNKVVSMELNIERLEHLKIVLSKLEKIYITGHIKNHYRLRDVSYFVKILISKRELSELEKNLMKKDLKNESGDVNSAENIGRNQEGKELSPSENLQQSQLELISKKIFKIECDVFEISLYLNEKLITM